MKKELLSMSKKGMSLNQIPGTIMTIGISAMFGAVILIVLAAMGAQTTDANATTAITASKNGLVKIFTWFVIIGTVIGAVIVIGYMVKAFQ